MLPTRQTPPLPSLDVSTFVRRIALVRGARQGFRKAIRTGPPAKLAVITWDLGLTMRWLAHVLARLAIAATCTSSAAALDADNERGVYPSSRAACGSISCPIHSNR
jgi:hypothetical protein